ncbi:DUF724 domain-containing protein 7-like [Telopea speciosissima]|uniref:DUF724 domain-containing protein 7-like n=1 Tax=Telopea speciosissima TaxID=54955 RepID=UPI001CC4F317|nr:DUF724 domain-containing protein 7-like [Telopea speciosissima]
MADEAFQRATEVSVAEERLSIEAAALNLKKRWLKNLPTERGRLEGTAAYTKDPTNIRNTSETQVGGIKAAIQRKEPDLLGAVNEVVQRALEVPVSEKGRLSTEAAAQSIEKGKKKRGRPKKIASDVKVPTQGVSIDSQLISLPNRAMPPILETLDAQTYMVPVENQGLLFFESSRVREKVESMEAFQLLPQRPHFSTLDQYNEELREGLAIGYMVAFANLVEKTCKSQLDDPRSMLENKLKALVELETLGFQANPMKSRLQELLDIKDRQVKLKEHSRAVEDQIVEKRHVSSTIDAEIDEIDRKLNEQQQSLTVLNKKRASVMAQKKIKCSNIDAMEREVDLIKKKVLKGKLDFDHVIATPW